jgi:hypothetical protein
MSGPIAQSSRIWARFTNLFRAPAAEELAELLWGISENVDNAHDGGKKRVYEITTKAIMKVRSEVLVAHARKRLRKRMTAKHASES